MTKKTTEDKKVVQTEPTFGDGKLHLEETKTPGIFLDRELGVLVSVEETINGQTVLNNLNYGRKLS